MRPITLFLVLTLLISTSSCGQENLSQELATEYCNDIKKLKTEGRNPDLVLKEMMELGVALRNKHPDKISVLRSEISERIESSDELEIAYAFALDFTGTLLENCPEYLTATRQLLPQKIDSNTTVGYVSGKVQSFLKEWPDDALDKKYQKATDSVITYLRYSATYLDDYPDLGYGDLSPQNDVQLYLLRHSDEYLKAFLANSQLAAMGYEVVEFPKMPEITIRIND